MDMTKSIILALAIILFALGAWPITLIMIIILIFSNFRLKRKKHKAIEELERENEALRNELADQAVRRAMDKAENREKRES